MSVRAMLARVQRLEHSRRPTSPFELWFGTLDVWEADCWAGIDAGLLDPTDVPLVLTAVRRWHKDGAWAR